MRLLLTLLLALTAVAADKPAPVETDKRLQSDGKGWRVEKAVIKDAKLPRVLLIGDSILNGYQGQATKLLAGKAHVDLWVNPYNQSEHVNKLLGEVLANGPYDVVVFNMGLHGWQPGRIKPGTFEPLMCCGGSNADRPSPRSPGVLLCCRSIWSWPGSRAGHAERQIPDATCVQ